MSEIMKSVKGGVCAALGFRAASVYCGIKAANKSKPDLALVVSDRAGVAAGTFTTNVVQAAPVLLSKRHLRHAATRGVVLNSGNANACTGDQGDADALATTKAVAEALKINAKELLVCSTGRIGVPMPMGKIVPQVTPLVRGLARSKHRAAASAIMTSDTFPKEVAVQIKTPSGSFRIGGMAKGAGMINPNMATMLCVLTTDARLPKSQLQRVLREVVEATFNRITVDGDMSTNDTVLLLANGASGVDASASLEAFQAGLQHCCTELARMIVRDGEGTERVIELEVRGARTTAQARLAGEAAANSILLKCAWAGSDPNWGRILDAIGYSGAKFDPRRVDVYYDDTQLVRGGTGVPEFRQDVLRVAAKKEFRVVVDLHAGQADYTVLTTDLTEDFVRLNLSE